MAITREQKNELVDQYSEWIDSSRALIVTEYQGLSMKEMDNLRQKVREAGGEFHVIKNTLGKLAFDAAGMKYAENLFEGTTAIGFAFEDAPGLAKTMMEYGKDTDFLKVKCGYLGKEAISAADVQALAELPPLPVLRAQLLGVLMTPANQLARIISEPERQMVAVLRAYAEKDAVAEAA